MGVLDGVVIVEWKGAVFGGEFGTSHCNQWGPLLCSCAEVRAAIELSFWVVSGVTPGIHVLDGVHVPQREVMDFGSFAPIGQMVSMAYFVTEMYPTRA